MSIKRLPNLADFKRFVHGKFQRVIAASRYIAKVGLTAAKSLIPIEYLSVSPRNQKKAGLCSDLERWVGLNSSKKKATKSGDISVTLRV